MFEPLNYLLVVVFAIYVVCEADNNLPVQPEWTITDDKPKEMPSSGKGEDKLKDLLEIESIRSEIEKAVSEHKYAIGGEDEDKIVHEADEELGENFRRHHYVYKMIGEGIDDQEDYDENEDEDEPNYEDDEEAEDDIGSSKDWLFDIIPNSVSSSLGETNENDTLLIPEYNATKYSSDEDSSDVLQLNLIEEDMSFQFGEGVSEWKSLSNGRIAGVSGTKIILLKSKDGKYSESKEVDFTELIGPVDEISLWNATNLRYDTMIIVCLESSIRWLSSDDLSTVWKLMIGGKSLDVKNIESGKETFLAVLLKGTILVYNYDISRKEHWLVQSIAVDSLARQIEFIDPGYHKILAIPQNDEVSILQAIETNEKHLRFTKATSIPASNISSIHSFQMGGYSYLAVASDRPTIYRYHHGTFKPQTIFEPNFGLVEMFLSVPCRTYRDDMILLVQHKILFETHSLNAVEPLIWNGVAFEASKSVPCKIGNEIELFGMSCILDLERNQGLQGAAVIHSDVGVELIVPRHDAPSGLFKLSTELVPKHSEIEDLEYIYDLMEHMAAKQTEIIQRLEETEWSVKELETEELIFGGDFEKILLNGEIWTKSDSEMELDNLLAELEQIGKQIDSLQQDFVVEEALVKDLFVKNLNGQPINDTLRICEEKDTTVTQALHGTHQLDILEIDGNLEFESVNGIDWKDFMANVLFKDIPTQLERLNVEKVFFVFLNRGRLTFVPKVKVEGNVSTNTLNGMDFPRSFLLSSGPKTSIVSGRKKFNNVLNANAMDCQGTINKVDPADFITLAYQQTVRGTTTFSELEVTDSFQVNGTISGKNLDKFIANPTLLQTRDLKSEAQFRSLEIDGPVTITGYYNNRKFDEILDDVIYTSELNVLLNSTKTFNEIRFDIPPSLKSNRINDIRLDDFLTKSTDQLLQVNQIHGSLHADTLILDGLYDSINITELGANSVKLNDDQKIEGKIIFTDPTFLSTKSIDITAKLNEVPIDDFYSVRESITLQHVTADELNVQELTSICQIEGDGFLNGLNISKFNQERFSLSEDQTVDADIVAERIDFKSNLFAKSINGFSFNDILTMLNRTTDPAEKLRFATKLKIIGDLQVNAINGINAAKLWSSAIWLNRPNTINKRIHFLDSVYLKSNLTIESGQVNGRNFEDFINDLVLKSDHKTATAVGGTKKFIAPISVARDSTLGSINDCPSNKLASKTNPLKIEGEFQVDGDLYVHSLEMEGESFGDFKVQEIFDGYQYDPDSEVHFIGGEVEFNDPSAIDRLTVDGRINGLEGPTAVFESTVSRNMSGIVKGRKTFNNDVIFEKGLKTVRLNELKVAEFLRDVVYVNEQMPVEIASPIAFEKDVAGNYAHAEDLVSTGNVMGCALKEWLDNTLRLDQSIEIEGPVYFRPGVLDGNDLLAVYLNDNLMSEIFTLNRPQYITGDVILPYVHLDGSIKVKGMVNNLDIVKERENTLMIYGDQHITSPILTQSMSVLQNFETLEPIRDRNLRDIVTLHDDAHIQSSLSFKHIKATDLYTNDSISGINFTQWSETALKRNQTTTQTITGTWSVQEMTVESRTMIIEKSFITGNSSDLLPSINKLQQDYMALCQETMSLSKLANQRVSFLKYLEKAFEIVRKRIIDSVHPIVFPDKTFLLINEQCISEIYRWDSVEGKIDLLGSLETGNVDEVWIVNDKIFGTSSGMRPNRCHVNGQRRWNVNGDEIVTFSFQSDEGSGCRTCRCAKAEEFIVQSKHFVPDFNATVGSITTKMIEDLHSLHNETDSPAPVVSSPDDAHDSSSSFGHSFKDIAKKLWSGLQQLDDMKTIIIHAKKIYATLTKHDGKQEDDHSEHGDHDEHADHDEHEYRNDHQEDYDASGEDTDAHHQKDSHSGSYVAAKAPHLPPTLISLEEPHPALLRLQKLLDGLPLHFTDIVENTNNTHLKDIIMMITHSIHSLHTGNKTETTKRDAYYREEVKSSLDLLRKYSGATHHQTDLDEDYREAIPLIVGSPENRLSLIAVISPSDYQSIRVYFSDLQRGLFQSIGTHSPRSMTAIEIHDETVFAFIDNAYTIRVMKYKGLEGFTEWSSFQQDPSTSGATQLGWISLAEDFGICEHYYLFSVVGERVEFYETVMGGSCPVKVVTKNCRGWSNRN